jgi:hypothetical protein
MPAYDFICKENHTTEINCGRNEIPKKVKCSCCGKTSTRSFKNMGIRSHVKYGTGGGRDMKQS